MNERVDFSILALDFVDYGRKHYDNNQGHDNGKRFTTLERLMAKRQRDAAREMRKQARLAKKASS